jgi:hypothetical protein
VFSNPTTLHRLQERKVLKRSSGWAAEEEAVFDSLNRLAAHAAKDHELSTRPAVLRGARIEAANITAFIVQRNKRRLSWHACHVFVVVVVVVGKQPSNSEAEVERRSVMGDCIP